MFELTLEKILNAGLEDVGDYPAPSETEKCYKQEAETDRVNRLASWLAKRGGRATVRDVVAYRVAGIKNAAEARRLLRALAAQGRGRFVVERSGKTRQRKELFDLSPEV